MTATAAVGIIARPVDIVSGQKFLDGEDDLDFVLPSRLPVARQRYWRSGNPGDGVLGRGWNLFWESSLQPYQDGWYGARLPATSSLSRYRAATKPTAKPKNAG